MLQLYAVQEAEDFRHAAQRRLDALESDLAAARRLLASKEDKEHMVQRMQKIAEQLGKKAGALQNSFCCIFHFRRRLMVHIPTRFHAGFAAFVHAQTRPGYKVTL